MRKLIYLNTEKSNFLKFGLYLVIGITIFMTILQILYCVNEPNTKYDFSMYIIPLIFLIFVVIGYWADTKFNYPMKKIRKIQDKELLDSGIKCKGEVIEIRKQMSSSSNRNYMFSLKIKYVSNIYHTTMEQITPPIKNISEEDRIGNTRQCIVYEKEDATIRDESDIYYGTANGMDLLKFFSLKNLIRGLRVKTKKGYAFIVTDADIVRKML